MDKIEKAFYHDGYQLGMKISGPSFSSERLFSALKEMYAAIDDTNRSLEEFARRKGQQIACKKGCQWCCHQPVFAMDYELDFLKNYIEQHFTPAQQAEIKARATKKNEAIGKLHDEALLNSKFPCPLLIDGTCTAYAARPVACRIYLSSDVASCLHFYQNPEDKTRYPALLDFPMRMGRMMNEGFRSALKAGGHIPKEFRIEERLA